MTVPFFDLQGLATDMGSALLHSLWQVAVVAAALWGLLTILHRASPNLRHSLAITALALAVLWPISTFQQARAYRSGRASAIARGPLFIQPVLHPPPSAAVQPGFPAGLAAWSEPALPWLAMIWGAGVLTLGLRLMGGWLWLQRLRKATEPAPAWVLDLGPDLARRMGLRLPSLRVSRAIAGPFCYGLWRTVVVLPAACLGHLDARDLEALLAHEFAHLRRHDFLVNALQSVAELLLFHHPLAHWISAAARLERERCCDMAAVEVCGDARFYTALLDRLDDLRPAESSLPPPSSRAPASPALLANGASLMIRIQHLLGVNIRPSLSALFGAALVLTGIGLAAIVPFREGLKGPAILVPSALLDQVDEAARAEGVDPDLIRAMVQCESRFNPSARSPMGAMGLMQLMPKTAARFGVTDAWQVEQNLKAGAKYMRFLLDRYQGDMARAVTAYNAGEKAVDAAGAKAPTDESRIYSKAVMDLYRDKAIQPTEGSEGIQSVQGRLTPQRDGSWAIAFQAWMLGSSEIEITQGGKRLALIKGDAPEVRPYFTTPIAAIQPTAGQGPIRIVYRDLGSKHSCDATVPLAAGDFTLSLVR
ncbi:MAG: transglycosylase SLT domain-containing protein [Holophagaceae bacterium]|nr:transglycosylase SLT domain-containing protein [Holophagaceae bacterium]